MNQSVGEEDGEVEDLPGLGKSLGKSNGFTHKKYAISFIFLKDHLNAGGEQTGRRREKQKAVLVVQTRRGDGLPRADGHGCSGKGSGSRCILEGDPVGFADVLKKGTWGFGCVSIERTVSSTKR